MSVHCEKCGQASYLPHLVRTFEKELKARKKINAEVKKRLKWIMSQDWSFGNHGPPDVPEEIREIQKLLNKKYVKR